MGLKENQALAEQYTILQYFKYAHLPANLQEVSAPFCTLAWKMARMLPPGPETSVMLRKLLESKDAAVRAAISEQHPNWAPPAKVEIENTCIHCDIDKHSLCRSHDCACRKKDEFHNHPVLRDEPPAHPFVPGYPQPES